MELKLYADITRYRQRLQRVLLAIDDAAVDKRNVIGGCDASTKRFCAMRRRAVYCGQLARLTQAHVGGVDSLNASDNLMDASQRAQRVIIN